MQLAAFVAVAVLVHRGARDPDTGILQAARWTALVCCSSLLVTLSYSMLANGVNPAAVFGQTLAQADPGILQRELFRSAFMNFGFDDEAVRGDVRHEVFGAVLTAMVLSAAAERRFPLRPGGARTLHRFSLALGATLLIVSLSRSVLLGAMAWPLLALVELPAATAAQRTAADRPRRRSRCLGARGGRRIPLGALGALHPGRRVL